MDGVTFETDLGQHERRIDELEQSLFERTDELAHVTHELAAELKERRRAEDDRASLMDRLREAVRMRDEFLALASHELKTPVTALQLQIQAILASPRAGSVRDERLEARLRIVDRQVRKLTRLVDSLLELSRIAAGRLELELDPEPVDVAAVLGEVVARFTEESERVHSPLRLTPSSPAIGIFDRGRIEQLLTNLVSNAVKFGAGHPIELAAASDEESIYVTIQDHGIGVAAPDRQRIFERFERAVSDRHYGGFGLGLWIARQIVNASGGHIALASAPGEGALFTVRLPRAPTLVRSPSPSSPPSSPP